MADTVGAVGDQYIESVAPKLLAKFLGKNYRSEWLRVRSLKVQFKDLVIASVSTPSSLFGSAKTVDDLFPRPDGRSGIGPMFTIDCRIGRNPLDFSKDICILDFFDSVSTRPSTKARLEKNFTPAEEAQINEFLVKAGKPIREIKFGASNRLVWQGETLDIDFKKTMGRNALRCAVKVHFKTRGDVWDQYVSPSDRVYQDMNPDVRGTAYTVPVGAFSVFPHDIARPADADGFVEVPVYWGLSNDPPRSRGWSVEMDAAMYAMGGKYQGTIRVKLTPTFGTMPAAPSKSVPEVRALGSMTAPPFRRTLKQCPLVFAHRGIIDQNTDVENAAGMVERAYKGGADGIEADVYMVRKFGSQIEDASKRSTDFENDYDFVLSHDGNMNRLLGLLHRATFSRKVAKDELFSENEIVTKYTIAGIRQLERFTHCEIAPPLSRIFTDLKKYPLLMDVDTKPNDPTGPPWPGYGRDLGTKLAKMIYDYEIEKKIVVTGFAPEVVEAVASFPVPAGRTKIHAGITEWKGLAGAYLRVRNANFDVQSYESARLCNLKSMCDTSVIARLQGKGYPVGSYILYDVSEDESDFSYTPAAFDLAMTTDWIETDDVPLTLKKVRDTGCFWDIAKRPMVDPSASRLREAPGAVISSVSLPGNSKPAPGKSAQPSRKPQPTKKPTRPVKRK